MKPLFGGFPHGGAQSDVSATAEGRLYNRSPRLTCLPGVCIWMKNLPPKSGGCINNLQGDCGCVIGFANRPSVDIYNRSSAVDVCALASRGRRANPVLTYETALRRFFAWQSALFMGKWRTSGTQLRGRCAESRHAVASLRVPGYVRVSSLRDEMCLFGCISSTTALRR